MGMNAPDHYPTPGVTPPDGAFVITNYTGTGAHLSEGYIQRRGYGAVVVEAIPASNPAGSCDVIVIDGSELTDLRPTVDTAGNQLGITGYKKWLVTSVFTYVKVQITTYSGQWSVRVTPVNASPAVPPAVQPVNNTNAVSPAGTVLTLSTDAIILPAPAAGLSLYISGLAVSNGSATLTRLDLREGPGGTIRESMWLAANGGGYTRQGQRSWKLPAATALVGILSVAVSDVRVSVFDYFTAA